MFCKNCGTPIPEDSGTLCPECLAAQQAEQTQAQEASSQPIEEVQTSVLNGEEQTSVLNAEESAQETPDEAFVQMPQADAPTKKSKKRILIPSLVAVVAVVVAAALVICNWGSVLRTFASPKTYLDHVANTSIKQGTSSLSEGYGAFKNIASGGTQAENGAYESEFSVKLGDAAWEMIDQYAGGQLKLYATMLGCDDFRWLDSVGLRVNAQVKDKLTQYSIQVCLSGKTLATVECYIDAEQSRMWIGIPEMSDEYITVDLSKIMGMTVATPLNSQDALTEMVKALPSEKEFNAMLNSYIDVILKNIKNVTRSTETVTIDGVSQKLTVLNLSANEEELCDILIAVLEYAKTDRTLEKMLNAVDDYAYDVNGYRPDVYDAVIDAIDDAIDELADSKEDANSDDSISVDCYINNSNEIVGAEFTLYGEGMGDGQSLSIRNVDNGKAFATEIAVNDQKIITGNGTIKKGKMTGTYTLMGDLFDLKDAELFVIEIEDLDQKKLDDGILDGKVRLAMGDDGVDAIMQLGPKKVVDGTPLKPTLSDSQVLLKTILTGGALEFTFAGTSKESKVTCDVLWNDASFVTISLSGKESSAGKIELPKDGVDATDTDALERWAKNLSIDQVTENLKSAGVPDGITDLLEGFLSGSGSPFSHKSSGYGDWDY